MTDRMPCRQCGVPILPSTAQKTDGLCLPCKGGYRDRIEAGKRHRVEAKAYRQSPQAKYQDSLVRRVHEGEGGFENLSSAEQKYFAVVMLEGEVYNGGFDQFFWNSSGSYYAIACEALLELGATQSLMLLREAKQFIFGAKSVPETTEERRQLLHSLRPSNSEQSDLAGVLDGLDTKF